MKEYISQNNNAYTIVRENEFEPEMTVLEFHGQYSPFVYYNQKQLSELIEALNKFLLK